MNLPLFVAGLATMALGCLVILGQFPDVAANLP